MGELLDLMTLEVFSKLNDSMGGRSGDGLTLDFVTLESSPNLSNSMIP